MEIRAQNSLDLSPRLSDPDAFYEALIDCHRDLTDSQSAELNARIILILANQVGDFSILKEALDTAKTKILQQP